MEGLDRLMKWNDEYWPLLINLYKRKPEGVKPLYSRGLIEISLNLHIEPQVLYKKMFELRKLDTPSIRQMWEDYSANPRRLSKAVKTIQEKEGYGTSGGYFDGIEINETWEKDFRPLESNDSLTPVKLIIILDLYFQLTPSTMVVETEEVVELARMLRIAPKMMVDVMEVYQHCDPYLNKDGIMIHPLYDDCETVWNRYGNDDPEKLAAIVAQLKEYFK